MLWLQYMDRLLDILETNFAGIFQYFKNIKFSADPRYLKPKDFLNEPPKAVTASGKLRHLLRYQHTNGIFFRSSRRASREIPDLHGNPGQRRAKLNGQAFSAFLTTPFEHFATVGRLHFLAETVCSFPLQI